MKKKIVLLVCSLILAGWASAQDYKIAKTSGRLEINIGKVTVEGTTGNEIIFSSLENTKEKDERASGLRSISGSGLEDNTGLGINVADKDGVVTVRQLKKMNSPEIKILVPRGVIVAYSYESQYGSTVKFKNIENEIEVAAQYNSIELENITGPLTIKSIYGHVEASFGNNVKGPISIVSVYGYVDVALPVAIKADVKMSTSYGEIFAAPEFKIEVEKSSDMIKYSDNVTGKINGGGTKIDLNCNYGKVYLRKK